MLGARSSIRAVAAALGGLVMRVLPIPLLSLALGGCLSFNEFPLGPAACASFIVDDELMTMDPPDVFPEDNFDLLWFDRYVLDPPDGNEPPFGDVLESLALLDPATGDVLVQLDDRLVPKAILSDIPGGQPSQLAFFAFSSNSAYDSTPRDYLFHVEVHQTPGTEAECLEAADTLNDNAGELELTVPCDCDGHYSYGLRVDDVGTSVASPIPEGTLFDITWTNVYDGVHCEGVDPVSTGDFQVSVQLSGPMGGFPPVLVDANPLLSGTSALQSLSISDLSTSIPPAGAYDVTLVLDPDGVVPECASRGEVDTNDQIAFFSFDIAVN